MKRRTFVASGFSAFALGTGVGVLSRDEIDTNAEIKLYQTENLTNYLETEKENKNLLFDTAEDVIDRTLSRDFPDMSFSIERGSNDFDQSITDPNEEKPGKLKRADSFVKWLIEEKEDPAENANLLFGMKEFETNNANGISNVALMHKATSPLEGHGVLWYNPFVSGDLRTFRGIVLHELGHCFGLKHYHGGNVEYGGEDDMRSIMLSRPFARNTATNIFGENIKDNKHQANKFNDDITLDVLNL